MSFVLRLYVHVFAMHDAILNRQYTKKKRRKRIFAMNYESLARVFGGFVRGEFYRDVKERVTRRDE